MSYLYKYIHFFFFNNTLIDSDLYTFKELFKITKRKKNDVPLMDKEGEGLTRSCFY